MTLSDLSDSTQNYLKVIWSIAEWSGEPATTTLIAQRTGNRLSSVSDALKRLDSAGLIIHRPYRPIELTKRGHTYAVQMVRRHRLIETFLVETLGYTWDQVHDEAEVLEHAVSDLMISRIDTLLGYPVRDPHGDPIPAADGTVATPNAITLSQALDETAGSTAQSRTVEVERIADSDPKLLRSLSDMGLKPGTELTISEDGAYFSNGIRLPVGKYDGKSILVRHIAD